MRMLKLRVNSWDMESRRTEGWAEAAKAAARKTARRGKTKPVK